MSSRKFLGLVAAAMAAGLVGGQARAATQQYFDVNGASTTPTLYGVTNGSTYSWEDPLWAVPAGGATATTNFVQDGTGFARFYGGDATTNKAYTVTVGASEPMVGLYNNGTGVAVTISQAASTAGNLNITTNGGFSPLNSALPGTLQSFYIVSGTASVVINAPITGDGGISQHGSGPLSLFGANTYAGGTQTTGGQVINYNSNSSFGTGQITFTGTSGQALVKSGTAAMTFANPLVFLSATTSATNFVSGANGTTFSGAVTLPTGTATTTTTLQAGAGTSLTRFTGVISGPSNLTIAPASNTGGTIVLSGANTYTGNTTVAGAGTAAVPTTTTLKLGASNTIASTPMLILSGGKLDPGGFTQTMTSTMLSVLTANATPTIDYASGATEVDFADSSSVAWTGTLNLANWNYTTDKLRFGSSAAALTSDQLARIQFNGGALGSASLDSNGFVVPEPSSVSLLLGGSLLLFRRRRASR